MEESSALDAEENGIVTDAWLLEAGEASATCTDEDDCMDECDVGRALKGWTAAREALPAEKPMCGDEGPTPAADSQSSGTSIGLAADEPGCPADDAATDDFAATT